MRETVCLCVGGALVAWLFVSDQPAVAPRLAVPDRGCALPVLDTKEKPPTFDIDGGQQLVEK